MPLSKDDMVEYALSITKSINSYEKSYVSHHFVHEAVPHGDIIHFITHLVNMITNTLLVTKSDKLWT